MIRRLLLLPPPPTTAPYSLPHPTSRQERRREQPALHPGRDLPAPPDLTAPRPSPPPPQPTAARRARKPAPVPPPRHAGIGSSAAQRTRSRVGEGEGDAFPPPPPPHPAPARPPQSPENRDPQSIVKTHIWFSVGGKEEEISKSLAGDERMEKAHGRMLIRKMRR